MNISEIRIKLMEETSDRLRAFCSITIDECFVIRDLKIIDGTTGPFVAMPSRKLTGHCQRCHYKNHLRASFCNNCGSKQSSVQSNVGAPKLYADVAHPINSECREMIQAAVIAEFEAELSRAGEPGYRSRYDDGFDIDAGDNADDDLSVDLENDRTVEIDRAQSSVRRPSSSKPRRERADVADAVKEEQSDEDDFGAGIF